MKNSIKFLSFIILFSVLFFGCSKDDWLQGVDYEVDVTFTGDINEFDWFLDIDGYGEQANNFNPFGRSSFVTDDGLLNTGTTYSFSQGGLDEMSVYFSVRSQQPSFEEHNMSINIVIRKYEFNDDTGVETEFQIANFTKSYQRLPSEDSEFLLFKISTTKEVRTYLCEGTACQ